MAADRKVVEGLVQDLALSLHRSKTSIPTVVDRWAGSAARRHLKVGPGDAKALKLAGGEIVRVRAGAGGPRELVFEKVAVRVLPGAAAEFRVSPEEAKAAGIRDGDLVHIV